MKHLQLLFIFLCLAVQGIQAQVPAFPGADGYGRYAKGGRGGSVYYVTTLEDGDTPGTLRYGVTRLSNVTILFKVSGTIHLNSALKISQSNITIAGQSAPGDGICVADYPVSVQGNNVIVRYMRFRMGDWKLTAEEADGGDAFGGRYCNKVIIDHCSISWSTDECASFYANRNFTMQWCIISESLRASLHSKGNHGYGAIWGGMGASYYHNLMIHHDSRTPRFGTGNVEPLSDHKTDMRNNVIYNWSGNGCYGAEGMYINIINNYYQPGPASTSKAKDRFITINDATASDGVTSIWGKFYLSGNLNTKYSNVTKDNWAGAHIEPSDRIGGNPSQASVRSDVELGEVPELHQHTVGKCYPLVIKYAGCSHRRDAIDTRLAKECETGTTTYRGTGDDSKPGIINTLSDLKPKDAADNWSPWPELTQTEAPADTDNDGIPDTWESSNGLDPNNSKDANNINEEGYTMLEVYLNSLVADITAAQYEGSTVVGVPGTPYDGTNSGSDLEANVSATWTFETGAEDQTATYSSGYIFTNNSIQLEGMKYAGQRKWNDEYYTQLQPTIDAGKEPSSEVYAAFTLTPYEGVTFRPTKVSFDCIRIGTGGCNVDYAIAAGNDTPIELATGIHPNRNNSDYTECTSTSAAAYGVEATNAKPLRLILYVYNLATSKQIALKNIVIEGAAEGSPTGIKNVTHTINMNNAAYDIQGRKANKQHLNHGIYIIDGKKMIFKE